MGNHIASIHWEHNDYDSQDIKYLEELANKYSISVINDKCVDYYPNLNNFGVEYVGIWAYLIGYKNVEMKLKCFLYDASQYFNRRDINYTTNLDTNPI